MGAMPSIGGKGGVGMRPGAPGAPAWAPGASQAHAGTGGGGLVDDWLAWLAAEGFRVLTHITLTFDDRGYPPIKPGDRYVSAAEIGPEKAMGLWKKLVHELNVSMCARMGGKGEGEIYRRWWKHSYFGYLVCLERQKRGTLHLHAVVDNWVDYDQVHRLWQRWAGFAWCRKIDDGDDRAIRYVLKYVTKAHAPSAVWLKRERVLVPGAIQSASVVHFNAIVQAYLEQVAGCDCEMCQASLAAARAGVLDAGYLSHSGLS